MGPLHPYRLDVVGFCENLLGIQLHAAQRRILAGAFPKDVEPLDWPYKYVHIAAGNRTGKSVLLAVLHIWFATYKHRLPFPFGSEEWFDSPYTTINICPLNDISLVVREKVSLILEDRSKEQISRVGGRGHVSPFVQALFMESSDGKHGKFIVRIPDTEYDGLRTHHNSYLEFRTADDHAKALQGRMKHLVTFDEAGRHKDPLTLIASDIAPRTIDSRGVLVTATTPHLETEGNYEEVWEQGNPDNPDKAKFTVSFRASMRENPHVTPQMIEEALAGQPDYLKPQILDGEFVQGAEAFYNAESINRAAQDIPNQRRRTRGHTYVCAWDLAVAKDGDSSVGVVWDVTNLPVVVTEVRELPKGTKQPAVIREMAEMLAFYNEERFGNTAIMTFDETGMGGRMIADDLAGLRPRPKPFNFAGNKSKKLSILMDLKVFLDKGRLVFPRDCQRLIYELKRYKRNDVKEETDSVMSMAMAARWSSRLLLPHRKTHLITQPVIV